jgi:hypothetical protein
MWQHAKMTIKCLQNGHCSVILSFEENLVKQIDQIFNFASMSKSLQIFESPYGSGEEIIV